MATDRDGGVAFVTGGASGIGRALATELGRRGFEVVVADRQVALAEEAAAAIRAAGGRATAVELDVRDGRAFAARLAEVRDRGARLAFLFNNAGIGVGGEIRDYEPADWDDVFDVNLRGVAHGVQAAYPIMLAQGSGHIVNTASVAGLVATSMSGSYTATKHAVVGLTKALRIEAKAYGVRASVICPGAIRTPILAGGRYGRMRSGIDAARVQGLWERARPLDPDLFARRVIPRVLRNEAIIVEPRWWKLFWYLERLSPSLWLAIGTRAHVRMKRELVPPRA